MWWRQTERLQHGVEVNKCVAYGRVGPQIINVISNAGFQHESSDYVAPNSNEQLDKEKSSNYKDAPQYAEFHSSYNNIPNI